MGKGMMKEVFTRFCQTTTLHGFHYVLDAQTKVAKVLWTCTIFLMVFGGIKTLIHNTIQYSNSRLITSIESSTSPLEVNSVNKRYSNFNVFD